MENYGLGSTGNTGINWDIFEKKPLITCPLSILDAIPLLLGWREENAVKCDHLCMKVNLP